MIGEEHAAAMLRQVIAQGRAAEFIQRVCWNGDAFTFDAETHELVIIDAEQLEWLDG